MPVIKVKSEEVKIKVPVTVLRIEPTTQAKTVEPTIEKQVITPDEGIFALSSITVNPVTSEIDENIKAENIKEGVSILGVDGTIIEATSDMVNINDYLETTITSENSEYFFIGGIFKKFPENFKIETPNVTRLFCYFKGKTLPNIDTSNCVTFEYFLSYADKVEEVQLLDFSNATNISSAFSGCSSLREFGGLKDFGKSFKAHYPANYIPYTLTLSSCTKLTEQSLINVLNNLYDIASLGVEVQKCVLGSTNLAKLTSAEGQQALATAQQKGWTVS